jgi:TPR repeat protein
MVEDIMTALKRSLRERNLRSLASAASAGGSESELVAAAQDAEAQYILGELYRLGKEVGQDFEKAAMWYRKSAEQGHAEAQVELGLMYSQGRGVAQDYAEGAAWTRRAADQGLSAAQFYMGLHCGGGHGIPLSWAEAAQWFRKAADQGHDWAQLWLGYLCRDGLDGGQPDDEEAVRWFGMAGEAGNADAQFHLGQMYVLGRGVTKDPRQAAEWYRRAADQGHEDAQKALGLVSASLPPRRGLDKVAGMHDLKALLRREVVDYVRNPERHRRYGLALPNGILLYGPPGCGKTYIARLLAEELGHHFVEITPGDIASPYVHDSVKQIRAVFDEAAMQAPSVMFIDEFEAFVPPRGALGGHQHHKAEEVNEFLTLLNGCSEKKILVGAATNLPENIDPAVLRTGRLDKLIYVGPPDAEARRDMLALHLENRPVAAGLDLVSLADETKYYSASDIKYLVDQAARHAMENDQDISHESFASASARVRGSITPEIEEQYRSIEQRGS